MKLHKLTRLLATTALAAGVLSASAGASADISLTGAVGGISDPGASSGGYYLRYVGDPAPAGFSHVYQWGTPAIDCAPRTTTVVFEGTVQVGDLIQGNVAFIGLLDKPLLANGYSGFMSGAYAYILRNSPTTVLVGPTDGNLGGEIVQVFQTYDIGSDGSIALRIEIGNGTVSVSVDGQPAMVDTYGDVVALNNAVASGYYTDHLEFANGAVPGWTLYDAGSSVEYAMTLSGCVASGQSPNAIKSGVRDALAALAPSGDKKTDDRVASAIRHLDKSLAADLWADDSHLTIKGAKVFDEEKSAVADLVKITTGPDASAAADAVAALLDADQQLAQTAIDEASDGKEKTAALNEMAKAADEIAKGHYDAAIDHFKKAWQHAIKA